MNTQMTGLFQNALSAKRVLGIAVAAAAFTVPTFALADAPVTEAPPIDQASASYNNYDNYGNTSESSSAGASVFSWKEIPENRQVPIERAVFDQGGYQLYDTVGETIVVPFANNNLYVMKFAVSPNGSTYFVNDGTSPILFLPRNGYLDNASVSGARWFPFSDDFHPVQPVFLGIAPSYDAYCNMGWYPDMFFYGGYYNEVGFGLFTPTLGLFINIGGHPYYGWGGYQAFFYGHPDFYREGYYHPYVYAYAGHQYWGGRTFHGYGGGYTGGYGFNHNGGYGGNRGFGENGARTFYGSGRAYNTETHSFSNDRGLDNNRSFSESRGYNSEGEFGNRGAAAESSQSGRVFHGAGGSYTVSGNGAESRSQGSSNFGNRSSGNGRTFNGGNTGGFQSQTRSYGNGNENRGYGHTYDGNGESSPRTSFSSFSNSGGENRAHFHGASGSFGGSHASFSGDGGNHGGGGGGRH